MEYRTGNKLHADVDDCGLPVSIVLTAASVHDSQVAIPTAVVMKELDHVHPLIVDAMPSNFFNQEHIEGAVNMPLDIFDFVYLMRFANKPKDSPIVVYGNTVSRPYDLEVADKLVSLGYKNVKVLDGGLTAWERSGYPVERGASQ